MAGEPFFIDEDIIGNNNPLKSSSIIISSPNTVINYNYMYNNNGYPTERKWQDDENGETTIKYSYNK
ncbi:hypothetical protein [Chryseobacterium fistulae]|uniref:Uncharacterized protein n=1 Tax=Chryseobacterium fistulae TaxID=2675058 RepID=A0A6N4XX51_9FLAO|nr:hypothetical protein [Chryseobacterium fistulae]CAA7393977.1 hypothetical protein CHRY9393_03590 [Chryseobacterium fistulae]